MPLYEVAGVKGSGFRVQRSKVEKDLAVKLFQSLTLNGEP
jgi:hypothetical protein